MKLKTPTRTTLLTLAIAATMLTNTAASVAQTTTLGTRGSLSQESAPITSNANAWWRTYDRPADYPKTLTLPLQFITTSTGDKIAVTVSVPADYFGRAVPGRFPAILTQTAYRQELGGILGNILPANNSLIVGGVDRFMVERGYISVAVDSWGTGMSSGVTELIGEREQKVYGETVEWITKQPWFNGNLGLAGSSYLGITSLLTASQQHPAVKAVFAEVPMGDAYRGTVAPGGMLNVNFLGAWSTLTQNLGTMDVLAKQLYPEHTAQIEAASQEHAAAINTYYLPTLNNVMAGTPGYATDDGNFWSVRSPIESAKKINVPTFIVGGTNDIFQRDEPLLYEQLKRRVNTKLLIVEGAHVQSILNAMGDHNNLQEKGAPSTVNLLLAWFDQYLKGRNAGAESMPNVTQYVQGLGSDGGRYATSTDWPHPQLTPRRMYLRGDLKLSLQAPTTNEATHTISEPKTPATVSASTSADGKTLSISTTANDGSDCSSSGVQWSLGLSGLVPLPCHSDNGTVDEAQGALTYTTPPMLSSMYLNGPMQANIWMSATNPQASLTIRVSDVDPFGKARPISTGIQSAVHRAVDTSRSRYINGEMIQPWHPFTAAAVQPLKPNEPVLVPVEIFPAAAVIKPGHRLRISISASNQVQGIWSTPAQAAANGNVTTIYNDPARPSSIVLPVVPSSTVGLWN